MVEVFLEQIRSVLYLLRYGEGVFCLLHMFPVIWDRGKETVVLKKRRFRFEFFIKLI